MNSDDDSDDDDDDDDNDNDNEATDQSYEPPKTASVSRKRKAPESSQTASVSRKRKAPTDESDDGDKTEEYNSDDVSLTQVDNGS